jgi:uncharacterized protein (DUF433 family)
MLSRVERITSIKRFVHGGAPCFAGSAVPVAALFDNLLHNRTTEEFLADHPDVSRRQVTAVLELAKQDMPWRASWVMPLGETG